jgi:uncharacterized protein YacL (UPF0231 family)
MKLSGYGYKDENQPIELTDFLELAEISLFATPEEIRKIASFLNASADNMEKMGNHYDHEHLSDKQNGFNDSPHFVVFNALNSL